MKSAKEPSRLKQGKEFHKKLQEDWEQTGQGEVTREYSVTKPSGRHGRIDIRVDAGDDLVAVVEIKASDWDVMDEAALRRNVNRQVKQVWDYIESQLAEGLDISPGIIFPERPANQARMLLIEQLFDQEGIPVVWQDESTEDRKARD